MTPRPLRAWQVKLPAVRRRRLASTLCSAFWEVDGPPAPLLVSVASRNGPQILPPSCPCSIPSPRLSSFWPARRRRHARTLPALALHRSRRSTACYVSQKIRSMTTMFNKKKQFTFPFSLPDSEILHQMCMTLNFHWMEKKWNKKW
jgi:hypothetical protein